MRIEQSSFSNNPPPRPAGAVTPGPAPRALRPALAGLRETADTASISRAAQDAAAAASTSGGTLGMSPHLFAALVRALTAPGPSAGAANPGVRLAFVPAEAPGDPATAVFRASTVLRTTDGRDLGVTITLTVPREYLSGEGGRRLAARLGEPLLLAPHGHTTGLPGVVLTIAAGADGGGDPSLSAFEPAFVTLAPRPDGTGRPLTAAEVLAARGGLAIEVRRRPREDGDGRDHAAEDETAFAFFKLWSEDDEGETSAGAASSEPVPPAPGTTAPSVLGVDLAV